MHTIGAKVLGRVEVAAKHRLVAHVAEERAQLARAVCELAAIAVFTGARELPVTAQLRLVLDARLLLALRAGGRRRAVQRR